MTKESRPLTQEQRKEFVQLLKDAKERILNALSSRHWKRTEKAREAAMAALMNSLGATKLHEKVVAASKELKDSEKALKTLGFRVDERGQVVFTSEGEGKYESQFNEQRDNIMDAEVESARKGYELAILNVLATESVEEAKGIVEPLV